MSRKSPRSVLIIESRFYEDIADELARGAVDELEGRRIEYERIAVPGSLEIPLALSLALSTGFVGRAGRHRGCIALGCVIRGETTHYDHICAETARSLQDLAVRDGLAIGYGILTVENEAQALVRAAPDGRDKGGEATRACLALVELKRRFQGNQG